MRSRSHKAFLVGLITIILIVIGLLLRGHSREPTLSITIPGSLPAADQAIVKQRVDALPLIEQNTGTVDVCGYGKVALDEDDPAAVTRHVAALSKPAAMRWLSALQDSGDLRARVAGMLLEGKVTGGDPMQPVAQQTRDAVAQLAAGAQDAAVYAMAVSMCGTDAGNDAACQQISLQRWAQLDSDNAVPWILLAGKDAEAHDRVAEAAAFRHAAMAHKIDSYVDSLYSFAEPLIPQDSTPLERSYFATEVIGIESATRSPYFSIASRHCTVDTVQDPDIRQQCSSLAELLVGRGTVLLDLGIGKAIGARAGWSTQRVNGLTLAQNALMGAAVEAAPSDNDTLWTCDSVNRLNAFMVQRVHLGELGALREVVEHSGESLEVLAQKYDQYIAILQGRALKQEEGKPSAQNN